MSDLYPFPQFEARIRKLFAESKYLEVINLIDDEGDYYPAEHVYLKYWQIGMAARDDNPDLALQYLDQLLEEGAWISQLLLRTSPSLEIMQDLVEFDERVKLMAQLQRAEQAKLLPLLTLRRENEADPPETGYPTLIGLHADRSIALTSIKFWHPVAQRGWLVGVPQSSQALWSGAYIWEDRTQAQLEISDSLGALQAKYPVNARRTIIAGHRGGGELAAWLPAAGGIDVVGFIAVAPSGTLLERPEEWLRTLHGRIAAPLRGVFIVPEGDARLPEIKRITDIFNAHSLPARLEVLPGVGADYQPEYDPAFLAALDFILT